jgi:hypothetical protein
MTRYVVSLSALVEGKEAAERVRAALAPALPLILGDQDPIGSLSLSVTALDEEEPLPTAEDDPRLLDVLARAGEEWGPVRVAVTAAVVSDPVEVVRALVVAGRAGALPGPPK